MGLLVTGFNNFAGRPGLSRRENARVQFFTDRRRPLWVCRGGEKRFIRATHRRRRRRRIKTRALYGVTDKCLYRT